MSWGSNRKGIRQYLKILVIQLKDVKDPYYHQRIGDYRVILTIDDDKFLISFLKVRLRKNVYDNRYDKQ